MTALLFWTYTLLNLFCKYFYFQITLHACFEEKEFQLTNSREREREVQCLFAATPSLRSVGCVQDTDLSDSRAVKEEGDDEVPDQKRLYLVR